jgi:hypothetical protein
MAFLMATAPCPARADEAEYDGKVDWSVSVPEIETTLYGYLTKERPYKVNYNIDVHKTSHAYSEVVGVLTDGDEFSVAEAYTAWSEEPVPIDMGGDPVSAYISTYKIESADLEGWIFGVNSPVHCLVRFEEDYYPLREGPSTEYEILREEKHPGPTPELAPTVERGRICRPSCKLDGWMSVGREMGTKYGEAGGWLPADTPGLEFFVPAFSGCVWGPELISGGFVFMIPCGSASQMIYESSVIYPGSFTTKNLSVTAVDRAGHEYAFERGERCGDTMEFRGLDFAGGYIAYKADTAVDWTEVERVYVKLNDPERLLENDEFDFEFPNERLPKE